MYNGSIRTSNFSKRSVRVYIDTPIEDIQNCTVMNGGF